jgi:signal transduction histidine kinase
VMIMANAEELRRALDNLVANAVRHASSRVELTAELDQAEVVLTVRDDGPGVPISDRDRVFERFTRLDDARTRDSGGTGLGLPIARELVQRAGGQVSLVDADPPWTLRAEIRMPRFEQGGRPP